MNNRDGTLKPDPEVLIDGNGMGSAVGDYDQRRRWSVSSDPTVSRIGNRL